MAFTTYKTFMVGSIALAGLPPLAGFWSKPEEKSFEKKTPFSVHEEPIALTGEAEIVSKQIKESKTEEQIRSSWEPKLSEFKKIRKKYLLYPDFE